MAQVLADTIFFCSPTDPDRWYPNLEERDGLIGQLRRRITFSIRMDGTGGNNRSVECVSKLTELYKHFGFKLDGSSYDSLDLDDMNEDELEALVDGLVNDQDLDIDPIIGDENDSDTDLVIAPPKRRRHVPVDSDSDEEVVDAGYAPGFDPGQQAQHAQGL